MMMTQADICLAMKTSAGDHEGKAKIETVRQLALLGWNEWSAILECWRVGACNTPLGGRVQRWQRRKFQCGRVSR